MAGRFLISVIAVAIAGWAASANAVSPEPISSNVVNRMSSTSDIRTKQCLERISSIVKPAFAVALSNGVTDKNGLREYFQLFKYEYKVGPTAYDKTLSQFDDYREYYYAHECNDVFPDPEKDAQNAVSIYKRRLKEQTRSDQFNY